MLRSVATDNNHDGAKDDSTRTQEGDAWESDVSVDELLQDVGLFGDLVDSSDAESFEGDDDTNNDLYHVESLPDVRTDHDINAKRAQLDRRLKSRFEAIFEKYERDFEGIGDEIDLRTGKIVVNNGHLTTMANEQDAGIESLLIRREAQIDAISHSSSGSNDLCSGIGARDLLDAQIPTDVQILAQFGPQLGPQIVEIVARRAEPVDEIETAWRLPDLPGFSRIQQPILDEVVPESITPPRSRRSSSPEVSLWAPVESRTPLHADHGHSTPDTTNETRRSRTKNFRKEEDDILEAWAKVELQKGTKLTDCVWDAFAQTHPRHPGASWKSRFQRKFSHLQAPLSAIPPACNPGGHADRPVRKRTTTIHTDKVLWTEAVTTIADTDPALYAGLYRDARKTDQPFPRSNLTGVPFQSNEVQSERPTTKCSQPVVDQSDAVFSTLSSQKSALQSYTESPWLQQIGISHDHTPPISRARAFDLTPKSKRMASTLRVIADSQSSLNSSQSNLFIANVKENVVEEVPCSYDFSDDDDDNLIAPVATKDVQGIHSASVQKDMVVSAETDKATTALERPPIAEADSHTPQRRPLKDYSKKSSSKRTATNGSGKQKTASVLKASISSTLTPVASSKPALVTSRKSLTRTTRAIPAHLLAFADDEDDFSMESATADCALRSVQHGGSPAVRALKTVNALHRPRLFLKRSSLGHLNHEPVLDMESSNEKDSQTQSPRPHVIQVLTNPTPEQELNDSHIVTDQDAESMAAHEKEKMAPNSMPRSSGQSTQPTSVLQAATVNDPTLKVEEIADAQDVKCESRDAANHINEASILASSTADILNTHASEVDCISQQVTVERGIEPSDTTKAAESSLDSPAGVITKAEDNNEILPVSSQDFQLDSLESSQRRRSNRLAFRGVMVPISRHAQNTPEAKSRVSTQRDQDATGANPTIFNLVQDITPTPPISVRMTRKRKREARDPSPPATQDDDARTSKYVLRSNGDILLVKTEEVVSRGRAPDS